MDNLPSAQAIRSAFFERRIRQARWTVRVNSPYWHACWSNACADADRWIREHGQSAETWTTLNIEAGRDRSERAA